MLVDFTSILRAVLRIWGRLQIAQMEIAAQGEMTFWLVGGLLFLRLLLRQFFLGSIDPPLCPHWLINDLRGACEALDGCRRSEMSRSRCCKCRRGRHANNWWCPKLKFISAMISTWNLKCGSSPTYLIASKYSCSKSPLWLRWNWLLLELHFDVSILVKIVTNISACLLICRKVL